MEEAERTRFSWGLGGCYYWACERHSNSSCTSTLEKHNNSNNTDQLSHFWAAGHQTKVLLLLAALNLAETTHSIKDLILHFTLKAIWKEGCVLKDFNMYMKSVEQRGGRLIVIWSGFTNNSSCLSAPLGWNDEIFRKDELYGLISKHILTQFKGMFDQAVCVKTPVRVLLLLLWFTRCLFYSKTMFVIKIWHFRDCDGLKMAPDYNAVELMWDTFIDGLVFEFCVHSWCQGIALFSHQFKSGDWKWFYQKRWHILTQEPHHGRVKASPFPRILSATSVQLSGCSSWFLKIKMNWLWSNHRPANKGHLSWGKGDLADILSSGDLYLWYNCTVIRPVSDWLLWLSGLFPWPVQASEEFL